MLIAMEPLSAALGVYKGATIAAKGRALAERFARGRTDAFIEARDEMHREWSAETAALLAQHIQKSREEYLALGKTLEEHERSLEDILGRQETLVLAALYADGAYREAIAERRRMLSFAAAALAKLDVTIVEKANAERVLHDLDPVDVLELHKLSRTVGRVQPTGDGEGRAYRSVDALRHALLLLSPAEDALISTRCMREAVGDISSGWGGAGGSAVAIARVTDRGRLLLRILQEYVDEKHDAFVGCGREELVGSRTEVDARKVVAEIPGLRPALLGALRAGRKLTYGASARFEPDVMQIEKGAPQGKLILPLATASCVLGIYGVSPESAASVPTPPPGHELSIELEDLPSFGRPATNVRVRGPYDVVRWLADDLDALWLSIGG